MRVHIVDPSAYTPPYDDALCSALAARGADVDLYTSAFAYGPVPEPAGYRRHELFYRALPGPRHAPSPARRMAKLIQHVPDMLRYRRAAREAQIVHFQWLTVQHLDAYLLPRARPVVLTAHDVLPREPRLGQRAAQRRLYRRVDAVVVHTEHGRRRLIGELGLSPERVHAIPHGALTYLTRQASVAPLPGELRDVEGPIVLCFGLMRPYKGLDVLLSAWQGVDAGELWIVGMPRMDIAALRRAAPPGVRWVPRFVADHELPAYFRRADLVVLPYREIDQSGVLLTALAFGRPLILSDVGGFAEVAATGAARLVAPGDPVDLRQAILELLRDPDQRRRLADAARAAAEGPYSWDAIADRTLTLYRSLTG